MRWLRRRRRTGLHLIVGHTHAFDPNIREMHRIIQSGELGRLGMILSLQLQRLPLPAASRRRIRPREGRRHRVQSGRPPDRDRAAARRPCAQRTREHGRIGSARPAAGHCTAFLDFENGAAASIMFSAYDFFDSDELHHWIAEGGAQQGAGSPWQDARGISSASERTSKLMRRSASAGACFRPSSPICRTSD